VVGLSATRFTGWGRRLLRDFVVRCPVSGYCTLYAPVARRHGPDSVRPDGSKGHLGGLLVGPPIDTTGRRGHLVSSGQLTQGR